MAVVLAAASYYRIGLSLYFAVRARRVRVSGGSKFHLELGTTTTPTCGTKKSLKSFNFNRLISFE